VGGGPGATPRIPTFWRKTTLDVGAGLAWLRGIVARDAAPGAGSTPIRRRRPRWRAPPVGGGGGGRARARYPWRESPPRDHTRRVKVLTRWTRLRCMGACARPQPRPKVDRPLTSHTQQKWVRAAARVLAPPCCRVPPADPVPRADRVLTRAAGAFPTPAQLDAELKEMRTTMQLFKINLGLHDPVNVNIEENSLIRVRAAASTLSVPPPRDHYVAHRSKAFSHICLATRHRTSTLRCA